MCEVLREARVKHTAPCFLFCFLLSLPGKYWSSMHSLETAYCCLPHNSHLNSGVFRGYQSLNCFTLLFKTSLYTSAAFTAYSSTQTFMFCTTAQWNVILKLPINVRWKMPFPNVICNLHLYHVNNLNNYTVKVVMLIADKNNGSPCLYQTHMHLRSSTSHAETTATFNVQ